MSGKQERRARRAPQATPPLEVRSAVGAWRPLRATLDGAGSDQQLVRYLVRQGYVTPIPADQAATMTDGGQVLLRMGGQYWVVTPGAISVYLAGAQPGTPVPHQLRDVR